MSFNTEIPMYKMPDGNVVQFWEMPVRNNAQSEKEGRPVWWRATMARVISPGNKNQIAALEVDLRDEAGVTIRRKLDHTADGGVPVYRDEMFKDQLRAWKEGLADAAAVGHKLDSWPELDVAQVAMLKDAGIMTLEQLTAVNDAALFRLGPNGRKLREGAKKWLDAVNERKPYADLAEKNNELERQLDEMRRQMEAFMAAQGNPLDVAQVARDAVPQPQKRKGGRPRKNPVQNTAQTEPVAA